MIGHQHQSTNDCKYEDKDFDSSQPPIMAMAMNLTPNKRP